MLDLTDQSLFYSQEFWLHTGYLLREILVFCMDGQWYSLPLASYFIRLIQVRPPGDPTSTIHLQPFTSSTILATIAWRIFQTNKSRNIRTSGRNLTPVITAVVESGAIHSATAIILLICITMNSVGLPVVMDSVPPLVVRKIGVLAGFSCSAFVPQGIIFCLVILQIHVYYAKDRELAPGGVSANWSIPWRREQRDGVSDAAS